MDIYICEDEVKIFSPLMKQGGHKNHNLVVDASFQIKQIECNDQSRYSIIYQHWFQCFAFKCISFEDFHLKVVKEFMPFNAIIIAYYYKHAEYRVSQIILP